MAPPSRGCPPAGTFRVPKRSRQGSGALRNAPAGFGYFRPVESTIQFVLCLQTGFDISRRCGFPRGAAPPNPRVTFHRGKVTKARRGPSPKGQEAPGPLSAQKIRQTGPTGGCRGNDLWGEKASVCGALSRGSGGVRHNGIAPPATLFSCTVNGTFSFRRDEKRTRGWNCGFLRTCCADWLAPPQRRLLGWDGAAPGKTRIRRLISKPACGR